MYWVAELRMMAILRTKKVERILADPFLWDIAENLRTGWGGIRSLILRLIPRIASQLYSIEALKGGIQSHPQGRRADSRCKPVSCPNLRPG